MAELALAAGAVFAAAFAQGAIGFGSGLISLALLTLIWEVQQVVAITAAFSIVMCGYFIWHLWAHISLREIRLLLLGAAAGVPLGVTALTTLDPRWIKGGLGVFLTVYALTSLRSRRPSTSLISPRWAVPTGFFSGLLSGAFNTGGPPMVLYGTERRWTPHAFRGNIQAYFLPVSTLTLIMLADRGVVTGTTLMVNLKLLPSLVLGMVVGDRLANRIEEALFRKILLYSLLVMGLNFVRAFWDAPPA